MNHGGYRPGAGRPAKPETVAKCWKIEKNTAAEIERLAVENHVTNGEMLGLLLRTYKDAEKE